MKKFLSVLTALCILISMTACANTAKDEGNTSKETTAGKETSGKENNSKRQKVTVNIFKKSIFLCNIIAPIKKNFAQFIIKSNVFIVFYSKILLVQKNFF